MSLWWDTPNTVPAKLFLDRNLPLAAFLLRFRMIWGLGQKMLGLR